MTGQKLTMLDELLKHFMDDFSGLCPEQIWNEGRSIWPRDLYFNASFYSTLLSKVVSYHSEWNYVCVPSVLIQTKFAHYHVMVVWSILNHRLFYIYLSTYYWFKLPIVVIFCSTQFLFHFIIFLWCHVIGINETWSTTIICCVL